MRNRKSLVREIERHMLAIGKHRDALREILAKLTTIVDALDDGNDDLEIAVQTLSVVQWGNHPNLILARKSRRGKENDFSATEPPATSFRVTNGQGKPDRVAL